MRLRSRASLTVLSPELDSDQHSAHCRLHLWRKQSLGLRTMQICTVMGKETSWTQMR